MNAYTYRVLVRPDENDTVFVRNLLAPGTGCEFCGWGCAGDFDNAEDNGERGEVWEYTTHLPSAFEQSLNESPAVIRFVQSEEVYV